MSGFRRKLRSILAGLVLWAIALGVGTGSAAETAGEVAPHFDLLKQLVSFFNFAIIVVVLVVFLRKPLKTMLENRRLALQQRIEEAERARDEAQRKLSEYEEKTRRLEEELEAIHRESLREVESEVQRLTREGEAMVARVREQARSQISQEVDKAKLLLKQEAANLALELAEKLLRHEIKPEDQRRLILESIDQVGKKL